MDHLLFTARAATRLAVRRGISASLVGVTVLVGVGMQCTMGDTGSIDFVSDDSTKGPKKPKPCAGDGECTPPTPYCDSVTATCIECLADPNCAGPKKICGPRGACVECIADANCAKGKPFCDVERSTCAECLLDAHCDAAKVCDPGEHRCVPSCSDSSMCEPMKPYCDAARRLCVECLTEANCAEPKKPACGPLGACVECTESVQCPADRHFCDLTANKCVGCTSDLDCPAGRHCDPMQHCAP